MTANAAQGKAKRPTLKGGVAVLLPSFIVLSVITMSQLLFNHANGSTPPTIGRSSYKTETVDASQ